MLQLKILNSLERFNFISRANWGNVAKIEAVPEISNNAGRFMGKL